MRQAICFIFIALSGQAGCSRAPGKPTLLAASEPDRDEVVYLKSGGEIRGRLVERDPNKGIVIRLHDGTVRSVPNHDLFYAGKAGTGSVRVHAPQPGVVSLDRQPVGRTPLDLRDVAPGRRRLQIVYDAGGSADAQILVLEGRVTEAILPLPKLQVVSARRKGLHLVLGGQVEGSLGDEVGVGLGPVGGFDLGVTPELDLRVLGHLGLGMFPEADTTWTEVAASAALRLHLSSVYSMQLGLRLGLLADHRYESDGSSTSSMHATRHIPVIGLQGSFLSISMGEHRNFDLTLWHALLLGGGDQFLQTGISLIHAWP